MPQPDRRRSDLAKIHIARKDLGMSEDDYRAMLWSVASVDSAGDLSPEQRLRVLAHLRNLGWRPRGGRRPQPGGAKRDMARKIVAIMMDRGLTDAYVDAIAKRMHGVERWQFLGPDQLHDVVAALEKDKRRREAKS